MRVEKNNIDRKVFSLKDFRGVDYASSPLEVKPYRATDMANLLLRDGQLQKRYGFKQVLRTGMKTESSIWTKTYDAKAFICGKNTYGDVILVQHVDYTTSRSTFVPYGRTSHNGPIQELKTKDKDGNEIPARFYGNEHFAQGVSSNGYFYLFYDQWIKKTKNGVEWEIISPYVPTTTINIPVSQYVVTRYDDSEDANTYNHRIVGDTDVKHPYQSNESLNMLTTKAKNNLYVKRDFSYDFVNKDANYFEEALGKKFFKLDAHANIPSGSLLVNGDNKPLIKAVVDGKTIALGEFELANVTDDTSVENVAGACWYNSEMGLALVYKRSSFLNVPKQFGRPIADNTSVLVVLDEYVFRNALGAGAEATDDKPAVNGYNIPTDIYGYVTLILEYQHSFTKNRDNDYERISGAKAVTLFGINGATDRVFVATDSPSNRVYFSENTIKTLEPQVVADVSYFPVDQWVECGTSEAPISGFLRATDGRLAIFKDVTNVEDISVYYTSGQYVDIVDEEIGTTYQQARFSVTAGDITRRGISARSVVNLEGDNIFTSEEGVYGIVLSNNVASAERYARERSRTINPKITKLGLKDSKGIVYNDKYFLAVGNGEVYVADARYKFTIQGDQQNTFNYEWFRLTGLWVKEWFILDGKLYFIDKDGYICEFVENSFTDQYLVRKADNELMVKVSTDAEGKKSGSVIFIDTRYYLIKASSYAVDHKGRKWEIDIIDEDAGALEIAIPDDIITETDIKDAMDLDLWFCVPISAYWQSAVMDLNQPIYLKNMWSLSMVASAKHGGKINLGYKTRLNAVSNIEVEGANDFAWGDDIDMFGGTQTSMLTGKSESFGMYTFDVGGYVGINTYRRRLFERNFAHIQLLFTSATATDCSVSEMDIEYSIARKNIGVG